MLDPRIALGGIQPQFSLGDWGATFARGQQLQAGQLALSEAQRQQAAAAQTRQAFAQQYGGGRPPGLAGAAPSMAPRAAGGGEETFPPLAEQEAAASHQALYGTPPTPAPSPAQTVPSGSPPGLGGLAGQMGGGGQAPADSQRQRAFIDKLYTIDPQAGRAAETHALNTEKAQFAQHLERVEYLGRVAGGVLEADTQQAYDVGRQMLLQAGMPASQMPPVYDRSLMQMYASTALDAKDKLQAKAKAIDQQLREREVVVAEAGVPLTRAKARREEQEAEALEGVQALEPGAPEAGGAAGGARPTVATRHNNPGNVKLGPGTRHWVDEGKATVGERATDGGNFLKFRDPQTGARAMEELLTGPGYRTLTVEQGMRKWSNNGYGADVDPRVPPGKRLGDLSPAERRGLLQAMQTREGFAPAGGADAPGAGGAAAGTPGGGARPESLVRRLAGPPAVPGSGSLVPGSQPATRDQRPETRSPRLEADAQRLTRLEELRDRQEAHIERLRPLAGSEAGSKRLAQAERELSRRQSEIDTLQTRLYEQGPESLQRKEAVARAGVEASLDKPLSSDDAALYGVPAGTTARELREQVTQTPAPLKGEAAKTYQLGARMSRGQEVLSALEAQGVTGSPYWNTVEQSIDKLTGALGTVIGVAAGGGFGGATAGGAAGLGIGNLASPLVNTLRTPEQRRYVTAQLAFLAGILRKESGAAITVGEYREYGKIYFPQYGDDAGTVAEKRLMRQAEIDSLQEQFPNRPLAPKIAQEEGKLPGPRR